MNRVTGLGLVMTLLGFAGYGYGLGTPSPGRAFAVTFSLVGIALVSLRGAFARTEVGR